MLFADDLVLCETFTAAVERENWRYGETSPRHGLRVSRTKIAYMPCKNYGNNSRNYELIQPGDDKLNTLTAFKYLGSFFDSNGGAKTDIKNRVKLAWMICMQLAGALCDKRYPSS